MKKVLTFTDKPGAPVIETESVGKTFPNGTVALSDISLKIMKEDFTAIIGSSGAGKSTYLRCLNRLIKPTTGTVKLQSEDVTRVSGKQLNRLRRRMGMIFQQFNLVRRLTVIENVLVGRLRFHSSPLMFTMSILHQFLKEEKELAFECLKQVGIEDLAFQRADTLSGGQQQRVAIARALAQKPDVFLADEPIASLDPKSADIVMEILRRIHEKQKIPVLINLHHIDFARRFSSRIIGMRMGEVVFDGKCDGRCNDLSKDVIDFIYSKKESAAEKADLSAPARNLVSGS